MEETPLYKQLFDRMPVLLKYFLVIATFAFLISRLLTINIYSRRASASIMANSLGLGTVISQHLAQIRLFVTLYMIVVYGLLLYLAYYYRKYGTDKDTILRATATLIMFAIVGIWIVFMYLFEYFKISLYWILGAIIIMILIFGTVVLHLHLQKINRP